MKSFWELFLVFMLFSSRVLCLEIGADSVVSINYGANAGFGQDSFSQIVLGMPKGAGPTMGSLDVLSLGKMGDITLFFLDEIMVDGPGYDLAVFENPFFVGGDSNNIYLEVAFVEISAEGSSFIPYPFEFDSTIHPVGNPARYKGLAGVWPVNSNEGVPDPRNPDSSGGDFFDLSEVGLENARFVKIIDAGDSIYDGGWDKGAAGFDLDAIVAIHWTDASNPFMVTDAKAISDTEIIVHFSKSLASDSIFPLEYFKLDSISLTSGDTILVTDSITLILVLHATPSLGDTMPVLTVSQYISSQTGENLLNRYDKQIEKYFGISEVCDSRINTIRIAAYPNPSFGKVMFLANIEQGKPYSIDIFNITGQKVRTIYANSNKVLWDTCYESGREVATGYYICKLNTGGKNALCKILLFR
ncbi:T9SS type A sorting domain-containing protein [candidate division WOR-3 bacterium]|nr:T9SS type A sorting domain-containing protein [candidate division WOR-3 bacterium]